jgi:hypothetical protein
MGLIDVHLNVHDFRSWLCPGRGNQHEKDERRTNIAKENLAQTMGFDVRSRAETPMSDRHTGTI